MGRENDILQSQYQYVVAELERLASEHDQLGEYDQGASVAYHVAQLQEWLDAGRPGPCPVDLAPYGLDFRVAEPPEPEPVEPSAAEPPVPEEQPEPPLQSISRPPQVQVTIEAAVPIREVGSQVAAALPDLEVHLLPELPPEPALELVQMKALGQADAPAEKAEPSVGAEDATETPLEELPADEEAGTPEVGHVATLPPSEAATVIPAAEELLEAEPEWESILTETPEQAEVRRQLAQVRAFLEAGDVRSAAALSRGLTGRPIATPELRESAEDLYDQAQCEFNARLDQALQAGDQARDAGNTEQARQYYQAARELDPENSHARRAVLELDQTLADRLSDEERIRLRTGLKARRNVQLMGDAVCRAEAWDAEGKLDSELSELLREARQFYDSQRVAMGQETTMMRFGDLAARHEAWKLLTDRVALSDEIIFDVTTLQMREAFQVLEEANKLYLQRSADTAQYEIDRVKKALEEGYPRWALKRLKAAVSLPFELHDRDRVAALLQEVEGQVDNQDRAEGLLTLAGQTDDPVKTFDLALQAQAAFPKLAGLSQRVEQARQTAAETVKARMQQRHDQARALLRQAEKLLAAGQDQQARLAYQQDRDGRYQQAREEVALAEAMPAHWPEKTQPQLFQELLAASRSLREEIDRAESIHQEFDSLVETIRQRVVDPDRRQSGLDLFREAGADVRFFRLESVGAVAQRMPLFPSWRVLVSELDQYRDVSEQLEEARAARTEKNWERVRELAQKIKTSGKAGHFAAEVNALHEEAVLDLKIEKVQQHLEDDEIREANTIVTRLFADRDTDQRRKRELEGLPKGGRTPELEAEYAVVRYRLSLMVDMEKRLQAERARILECISNGPPMIELFQRAESLCEKGGAAERLVALRLFRYVGGDTAERQEGWPEYRLSLRTTGARRRARDLAKNLRDDLLIPLQEAYRARQTNPPDEPELRTLAHRAGSLREARLLYTEEERAAVRWLEVEWGVRQARAKEEQTDWDGAVATWRELDLHHPRTPQVEAGLRAAEERQQAVDCALAQTEKVLAERGARDALQELQAALPRGLTQNAAKLKQHRDEVFRESRDLLLGRAHEELQKGTDEGKIQAVMALVDLRDLEEVIGLPESERSSRPRLEPLRKELAPVAKRVVEDAGRFDPTHLSLARALSEAGRLLGRLTTFKSVTPLFDQELGGITDSLENRRQRLAAQYDNLQRLERLLEEARDPRLWEQALRTGSFDQLDQFHAQIRNLNLNVMLDVSRFGERLDEYRDMRAYVHCAIVEARRLFAAEEAFAELQTHLRNLVSCPVGRIEQGKSWEQIQRELQAGRGRAWQHIQQSEYEAIRRVMGDLLRVPDVYARPMLAKEDAEGKAVTTSSPVRVELVGWEEVAQAAAERQAELETWTEWDGQCATLFQAAWRALEETKKHHDNTPVVRKRNDWADVQTAVRAVLDKLVEGPRNAGQPAPARSSKAERYREEGKKRQAAARQGLTQAGIQLGDLEGTLGKPGIGFPTPHEFKAATDEGVATGNWNRLETLLKRACAIGTTNLAEQKRVEEHQKVLDNAQKKKSFFGKIFGRG